MSLTLRDEAEKPGQKQGSANAGWVGYRQCPTRPRATVVSPPLCPDHDHGNAALSLSHHPYSTVRRIQINTPSAFPNVHVGRAGGMAGGEATEDGGGEKGYEPRRGGGGGGGGGGTGGRIGAAPV